LAAIFLQGIAEGAMTKSNRQETNPNKPEVAPPAANLELPESQLDAEEKIQREQGKRYFELQGKRLLAIHTPGVPIAPDETIKKMGRVPISEMGPFLDRLGAESLDRDNPHLRYMVHYREAQKDFERKAILREYIDEYPNQRERHPWMQERIEENGLKWPRSARQIRSASVLTPGPASEEPQKVGLLANTQTERKLFVEPILTENGWSILDWASNSKVDFHTADSYLKGKTNPFPSTRKKLADALKVKVDDLPK
jgi:hypothetical protein